MALKIDWSWIDQCSSRAINGDGFIINNYGHPSILRYIDGSRNLTLCYQYVDESEILGRRFLFFKNYAIHVQVPDDLTWDDGAALTKDEAILVISRICQTFGNHKKRPCRVTIDNKLYRDFADITSAHNRRDTV